MAQQIATVVRIDTDGKRRYLAWCDVHTDGLASSRKAKAAAWAAKHNEESHNARTDD